MIEQAIKSYYGERCPDHDADCVVCQAWEQWDKIRRPYNEALEETEQGERQWYGRLKD